MIFRRVVMAMAAAASFAAAAAVLVFFIAFAFYALLEPWLGRAGAAAAVVLAIVILMVSFAWFLATAGRRPRGKKADAAETLIDRIILFVQQKPVLAITAAIGAGVLAVRNPKYLGTLLRAFIDGEDFS